MELILALAADAVEERPDGKLDVVGVFNELSAAGFPALQDRMMVVFLIEWDTDEAGEQPLRADLVDEAGEKVLTIQGHTEVARREAGRPPAQTRLVLQLEKVVFPHPGRYQFELLAGEHVRRTLPLFVAEGRGDEKGPDPST